MSQRHKITLLSIVTALIIIAAMAFAISKDTGTALRATNCTATGLVLGQVLVELYIHHNNKTKGD